MFDSASGIFTPASTASKALPPFLMTSHAVWLAFLLFHVAITVGLVVLAEICCVFSSDAQAVLPNPIAASFSHLISLQYEHIFYIFVICTPQLIEFIFIN